MDVLPSEDDVARDIALWHLALVIPQVNNTIDVRIFFCFNQHHGFCNSF